MEKRYQEKNWLKKQYLEKELPAQQIADKCNVHRATIYRWMGRFGIEGRMSQYKYELNHNFFSEIDSEEKAYWLGFIVGDGSISKKRNSIRVRLQIRDKDHLEKMKRSLESTSPIHERDNGRMSELDLFSIKMKEDLKKYGVIPRKSKKDSEDISLNLNFDDFLLRHFWRGMIDSDGGVRWDMIGDRKYPRLYLTGNKKQCGRFANYCNSPKCKKQVMPCSNGLAQYVDYNGDTAFDLMEHFYHNSDVYLDRKYKAYKEVKSNIEND